VLESWLGDNQTLFRSNIIYCWLCAGVAGSSSDTENACGEESADMFREKHVKLSSQAGKPEEAGTKH